MKTTAFGTLIQQFLSKCSRCSLQTLAPMEPYTRKRPFPNRRDQPHQNPKQRKRNEQHMRGYGKWEHQHRKMGHRREGRGRGRSRQSSGRGSKSREPRGRGLARKRDNDWVSNDVFYSRPTDDAIAYGIDKDEMRRKLNKIVLVDRNRKELVQLLYKICQSPNRHCVRSVFEVLFNDKVFIWNDVKMMIDSILNTETINTDNEEDGIQMAFVIKSYHSFLCDTKGVDEATQMLLNRFEQHLSELKTRHPEIANGAGIARSPIDCLLDVIIEPGMAALYGKVSYGKRYATDPFESTQSLLKRTFDLSKEDITRPLLRGLRRLRDFLITNRDVEKFRDDDIRVYRDSQVISSFASISDGLVWQVQLDISQPLVRSIMNRGRRLLKYGTLICISNDFFSEDIVYGTVVENCHEDDLIKNGIVSIAFQQSFQQQKTGRTLILVESKSNSLSYAGALATLQMKLQDNEQLPFDQQLVYHQPNSAPPQYLAQFDNEDTVSFKCLLPETDEDIHLRSDAAVVEDIVEQMISKVCADQLGHNVFRTESWPSPADLGMDTSQYRAFTDGITQRLALIQGPPGTGKTVIALKMLELFLNNDSVWSHQDIGPIILLSYTNHALDQFLEGIVRMPKVNAMPVKDIVRVGSRSKVESLDKFNIIHRRKECKTMTRLQALTNLHEEAKTHNILGNSIRIYLTSLVHEECLRRVEVIPETLFQSLKMRKIKSLPADGTYLCNWLGIFSEDFLPRRGTKDENSESSEGDIDEVTPTEMLGLGFEKEDFEVKTMTSKDHMQMAQPIITTETKEDLHKGIRYWSNVKKEKKTPILQEVKRRILHTRPMPQQEESKIKDVWKLSHQDRWRLYVLWIRKILKKLQDDIGSPQEMYRCAFGRYKECRQSEDIEILKKARIVAMTTTRAANDHDILRSINPKIMVIEEAAEVPDHHVLACLVPSLQHLVMIGDHQQLRPSYNDYKTAMRYGLNVSVFERLVKAGLPFQQLRFQHRMRPEIADLLTPAIYPELQNHPSVLGMENVLGVLHNLYFLNHNVEEHESLHQDLKSHRNQHEVDFIAQYYRYLRLQGYSSEEITILTTYKEQERYLQLTIRTLEKDDEMLTRSKTQYNRHFSELGDLDTSSVNLMKATIPTDVTETQKHIGKARITTVDNFQGEENKIIILSLVRCNSKGTIGFLKESNRICVALSRAKAGLYVIGNCTMLRENSGLWKQILDKAEAKGLLGTSLSLCCRNHTQIKTNVSDANDFQKVPGGGCLLKCSAELPCGHHCDRICHIDDPDHVQTQCNSRCKKRCSLGHQCQSKCFSCRDGCKPCTFKVLKTLPQCGHTISVPCDADPYTFQCTEPCSNMIECGHQCQRRCGQPCNTVNNCNELVKVTAVCEHTIQTACHAKINPVCNVRCETLLDCGHVCKGTCHSCFARNVHQRCREKKQYKHDCGHSITTDCLMAHWDNIFGGTILKCEKKCTWCCEHKQCKSSCTDPCERQPCNVRCTEKIHCGHVCELLLCDHNGNHWCRKCSRDTVNGGLRRQRLNVRNPHHIRLQLCGCIFETEALDRHLMQLHASSLHGPRCPNCGQEITNMRYYSYIRRSKLNRINECDSSVEGLDKLWEEIGFRCLSKDILTDMLRRQRSRPSSYRGKSFLDWLATLIEIMSTFVEGNESVGRRNAVTLDRLLERLKKPGIASFQECRQLANFISKLAASLGFDFSTINSVQMPGNLHECENDSSSSLESQTENNQSPVNDDDFEIGDADQRVIVLRPTVFNRLGPQVNQ
ncbi:NFX1-type zinc finger-containing protein 1-like [Argopecten irradians]|uniref:NFX1-type zinc finger-containing protein 1-like n=1 Tax=Argopecten irradians TaxID=31199 RepID=UPI0037119B22